jgi:hypothetical protein
VAVVEQPPKGGDGVMICRDFCCARIHLAVLFICDVRALFVMGQDAVTGQSYVTIYGNDHILYVLYTLCCHGCYVSHWGLCMCPPARGDIVLCHKGALYYMTKGAQASRRSSI